MGDDDVFGRSLKVLLGGMCLGDRLGLSCGSWMSLGIVNRDVVGGFYAVFASTRGLYLWVSLQHVWEAALGSVSKKSVEFLLVGWLGMTSLCCLLFF